MEIKIGDTEIVPMDESDPVGFFHYNEYMEKVNIKIDGIDVFMFIPKSEYEKIQHLFIK